MAPSSSPRLKLRLNWRIIKRVGIIIGIVAGTVGATTGMISLYEYISSLDFGDQPEIIRQIASEKPTAKCQAEPRGSAVQLFERGWLFARFTKSEHVAVSRKSAREVEWMSTKSEFVKGVEVPCDSVERQHLLRLGFRKTYCDPKNTLIRKMLGSPVTEETRAWIQFQQWTDGELVFGLPFTKDGIEQGRFQILAGIFLKAENEKAMKGSGNFVRVSEAETDQPYYCTAIWYVARKDQTVTEKQKQAPGCKTILGPIEYTKPRNQCSVFGF